MKLLMSVRKKTCSRLNGSPRGSVETTVRTYRTIALVVGLAAGILAASPVAQAQKRPRISYFDRLKLANWKQVVRIDKSTKYWRY